MSDQSPPEGMGPFREYGNAPEQIPGVPYPFQPPAGMANPSVLPPPARQKKPLYFPLTRNASAGKQIIMMAIYILLMTILFVGNIAVLIQSSANTSLTNTFQNSDGTTNGQSIIAFCVLFFLLLPAMSLLCGAFFGDWRAFVVTCVVEGISLGIGIFTQHIFLRVGNAGLIAGLLLPPVFAAALVGYCYDRRRYAGWGKSFLCMLPGSALIIIASYVLIATVGNQTAGLTPGLYIILGCFGLVFIPLLALPVAAIEGITHAFIAARHTGR